VFPPPNFHSYASQGCAPITGCSEYVELATVATLRFLMPTFSIYPFYPNPQSQITIGPYIDVVLEFVGGR
jgi:hypothetical protein